jgi:uncharacterized protein (TIGR00270 family)
MDCEMCGKAGANMIAKIEGTQMTLCATCARHGTIVRTIAPPVRKKAVERAPSLQRQERKEELIESVHPQIAGFLREHRERLGLTQEQFARKLNIRASVYAHYESGSTTPSIEAARQLEHEIKKSLVVKIKVGDISRASPGEQRGMQAGDFIKRK